ncbi:MAG: hypothetical protein V5A27_08250 [Halapricum sp.]
MTTRTADRLDNWESRPFTDGYEGLRTLSDRSFSGAVTAGRATLYMLNGTVVGVLDGSIEDFEDATGTIHEAPTPALPLLSVIQERNDEVRAKYYTEDTPLQEANEKLSDGGFTGYIELSENILSGDYYVVYHGGKSMSVAFVGESERLISGDEAFEQADNEVGIYEVRPGSVEPIEIPEPEESAAATATTDSAAEPETADETADDGVAIEDDEPPSDEDPEDESVGTGTENHASEPAEKDPQPEEADQRDRERTADTEPQSEGRGRGDRGSATDSEPQPEGIDRRDRDRGADTEGRGDRDRAGTRARETESGSAQTDRKTPETTDRRQSREWAADRDATPEEATSHGGRERAEPSGEHRESTTGRSDDRSPTERRDDPTTGRRDREPMTSAEQRDRQPRRDTPESNRRGSSSPRDDSGPGRGIAGGAGSADESATPTGNSGADTSSEDTSLERRVIPSVDPDRTWTPNDDRSAGGGIDTQRDTSAGESASRSATQRSERAREASPGRQAEIESELQDAEAEIAELERRIDDLQAQQTDLETERDDLAAERDELQAELERVRKERDDLQVEVEELRSQVAELEQRLERAGDKAATAKTTLTPREAIDGTNLFIRYGSKGDETLKAAHDGTAKADAVNENLNLEYHTQFDAAEAAVDGQSYDEFLTGTIHYRFVRWVVRELLYEIHDTGHRDALADLYDAIPKIDRAELNASISVTYTENGEEQRTQETFDVVLRDRMGNPLVVINLNDSREAATGEMMSTLVTAATRVGESSERLAGAFLVTSSFFDPDALETASEATGGGILSRDKRESFVRLSRKDGFHLCLVESRDGDFHLAVPEL